MPRTSSTGVKELWVDGRELCTGAWRSILQAVVDKTYLFLQGSSSLDHSLMDDVYRLVEVNPRAQIDIVDSPLQGNRSGPGSEGFFHCSCSSCCTTTTNSTDAVDSAMSVEQLPKPLRPLIAALTAIPPTIEEVDVNGPQYRAVGDFFRTDPTESNNNMLWKLRMLVLGLMGDCPSVRVLKLDDCNISKNSEVERLCQGLASNPVLEELRVIRNPGFGSDSGCQHVSRIVAAGAPSQLRNLLM